MAVATLGSTPKSITARSGPGIKADGLSARTGVQLARYFDVLHMVPLLDPSTG
ncbi:MAG: hypothetical protein GDA36_02105 [Rhodobacteraceae bacterium]|nr:hypothetical protein [Paracoccaceae bacterium]